MINQSSFTKKQFVCMLMSLLAFVFISFFAKAQTIGYSRAYGNALTFPFPVEMLPSNDGSNRMFVVSQNGIISIFPNAPTTNTAQTFLNIGTTGANRITFAATEERGLLGMALHPNYRNNRQFFLYYTAQVAGVTRMILARYLADPANPNQGLVNSEEVLLFFDKNQNNTNHNGGKIAFGNDGFLYLSIGDGGGGGDPRNNAQNRNSLFGKILRIDIDNDDFPADAQRNYRIPTDNPFATGGGSPEIFAWGIRNMWKFSFDRVTGRLWGADVGQGNWEEVNIVSRGANYGWRKFEGLATHNGGDPTPTNPTATPPIFVYSSIGGASITGGYVYRGTLLPAFEGRYFYGDYVRGTIGVLTYDGTTTTNQTLFSPAMDGNNTINIASFGEDELGEMYFIGRNTQRIYRFTNTAPPPVGNIIAGVGTWSSMNNGVNGVVRAVATDTNGNVFVGGTFTTAGGVPANNIARWNPTTGWSALGMGTSGTVNAIVLRGNEVIVGGSFVNAGGQVVNNVAVWNGATWQGIGTGIDGAVRALAVNGADIFVGGAFINAGSVVSNNIARWNGMTWNSLGVGTNNEIRALTFDANTGNLFVGGNFSTAGGVAAVCIARWNSASGWAAVGGGTDGFVNSIALLPDGNLIVGGSFVNAGGVVTNRIARWNGTVWSALATGMSATVNALAVTNSGSIIAGGTFSLASGNIVNNVAIWNGTSWSALGAMTSMPVGTDGGINALAVNQTTVLVGGGNVNAGGITVNNIAQLQIPAILGVEEKISGQSLILYPNPNKGSFTLQMNELKGKNAQIAVMDLSGRIVYQQSLLLNGRLDIELNLNLAGGMYLLQLQLEKENFRRKLVVEQ